MKSYVPETMVEYIAEMVEKGWVIQPDHCKRKLRRARKTDVKLVLLIKDFSEK